LLYSRFAGLPVWLVNPWINVLCVADGCSGLLPLPLHYGLLVYSRLQLLDCAAKQLVPDRVSGLLYMPSRLPRALRRAYYAGLFRPTFPGCWLLLQVVTVVGLRWLLLPLLVCPIRLVSYCAGLPVCCVVTDVLRLRSARLRCVVTAVTLRRWITRCCCRGCLLLRWFGSAQQFCCLPCALCCLGCWLPLAYVRGCVADAPQLDCLRACLVVVALVGPQLVGFALLTLAVGYFASHTVTFTLWTVVGWLAVVTVPTFVVGLPPDMPLAVGTPQVG